MVSIFCPYYSLKVYISFSVAKFGCNIGPFYFSDQIRLPTITTVLLLGINLASIFCPRYINLAAMAYLCLPSYILSPINEEYLLST